MLSTRYVHLVVLMAALNLNGCAWLGFGQQQDDEFAMPNSVSEDLGAPKSEQDTSTEDTASDEPIADQDSAEVLARLKQQRQQTAVGPRDKDHEAEAKAAKPAYDQALSELKQDNLDSALKQFQQLSTQYPLLAGPIVNQAIILRKQGKLEQAYELLQNSLLAHAKNPYLLNQLGVISRQLGKFKQAQVSYETAIRIDEYYPKAHYNLAVLADLYLHDANLALNEFQIYQTLIPEPDKKVAGWIIELQRRAK